MQQMGQIFSKAERVIAWIGMNPDISKLFARTRSMLGRDETTGPREWTKSLENHVFWKRAWITQELVLARNLFFDAGGTLHPLHSPDKFSVGVHPDNLYLTKTLIGLMGYGEMERSSCTLIENKEIFLHKQCSEPRDRAYSLLSISRDGRGYQWITAARSSKSPRT